MSELKLSCKYEPLFQWLVAEKGEPLYNVDTVVITGGRYSQKSFAVGTFACIAAKDYNHRVLYTRYTLTSAKDSIIPEFTEKMDILNCDDDFNVEKDRINGKNGSKIVFKGIKTSSGNQTASLKSLKNFSMFVLEEAEEMPSFDNWDKIRKSIRALDVNNLNILILNPTVKTHWIYQELYENNGINEGFNGVFNNILFIHTTYLDVDREFIPDNIFNDFDDKRKAFDIYSETSKKDAERLDPKILKKALYYKSVINGGWLDNAEGVVFDNWSIGQFDNSLPFGFGQDFGFSIDPTTLVKIAVDKKHKKIYVKECFGKPSMSTQDIFVANLYHAGKDSLIVADSAEPRLITELRSKGLNIKQCIKGAGSVTAGIKALQEYDIIVSPCSVEIVKELNNYIWSDKKSSTTIDAWNHRIDPIRYYAYPIIKESQSNNRSFFAG